ncbi:MAG: hypothetical protein M0C28_20595 [Candidatus Moduliflexus flocculans]|nr:hypothetical protein [Candidatus Moduliflexus flocculans]
MKDNSEQYFLRIEKSVGRAINSYSLIKENDKVAVALSGGKGFPCDARDSGEPEEEASGNIRSISGSCACKKYRIRNRPGFS